MIGPDPYDDLDPVTAEEMRAIVQRLEQLADELAVRTAELLTPYNVLMSDPARFEQALAELDPVALFTLAGDATPVMLQMMEAEQEARETIARWMRRRDQ